MQGMGGMAAPLPQEDPMMMGAAPEPSPVEALPLLLQAVLGKWQGQEAQAMQEQDMLMQTLMAIAQPAPDPAAMFAEGAAPMAPPAGPMGGLLP